MIRTLWRAFVEAFRQAQADARRKPLILDDDTTLERLRNLLPKQPNRSLDSGSGESE